MNVKNHIAASGTEKEKYTAKIQIQAVHQLDIGGVE